MYPRAVFLDKDGTLIENVPYNVNPDKIRLMDGVLEGLQQLHAAGYKLMIISNQAGVAHGRFSESALGPVEAHMRELFSQAGLPLDGFYYCPHHPEGIVRQYAVNCFCRKPSPGLLFQAAREHNLNLAASWMVGDILNDVEAGHRADCRTILINNGNETEWKLSALRRPNFTVSNFLLAAQTIVTTDQQPVPVARPPVKATPSARRI
jgi:D-glycero-D-manno-heptose 1,7-bisphosphate phosphatase